MARWIIATLAFVGVGWLSFRYGHTVALVTMLGVLLFIAVFGGHGRRRKAGDAPNPDDASETE
jgi:CHASE2 domain-containing sensor protein